MLFSRVWLRCVLWILVAASAPLHGETPRPASRAAPLLFLADKDYAPLSYLERGEAIGLDVDMARSLSTVLGREVRVELLDWAEAQEQVLQGNADGLLSMSMTEERRRLYDFSRPMVTHDFGLFVRGGNTAIQSAGDLAGKQVGVTAAGLPRQVLQTSRATLVTIGHYVDGFERLQAGTIDAVAADLWVGAYAIEQHGFRNIVRAGSPFATLTGGIAVPKGNQSLIDELDRAIVALNAAGAVERIRQRWRTKEMMFFSRERLNWALSLAACGLVALLVIGAAALRKQITARTALRASEEKYRQVVENAYDIIFTVDGEGYCLSMNRAGQDISGFAGGTPRGVHFAHLVVPEHRAVAAGELQRVLEGYTVPRLELDIMSRQGQRLTLELDVHPIRIGSTIVGAQGIARDVTVRKELEAQLRQSQKMEALGRLAGGVAHDFNNLLTVVIGFAELAIAQLDQSSPVRSDIEEIRRAANSAALLTRQLLIFSRKSVVRPAVLDVDEIVRRLDRMLQRLVGGNIELIVRAGRGAGHVRADASEIEQVIMNLVVNARDAMPTGGTLTIQAGTATLDEQAVRVHQLGAPGEFAKLTVTDTGTGMTPEVQAQVFQPFFTTKGPTQGTGLGLATVHGIVQRAGGCIFVESAPGCGSTFTIYLPRVTAAIEAAPAIEHVPTASPVSGTILFVEDDQSIRRLGARTLSQHGYTVLTARHAEEAITLTQQHPGVIDLLLTDIVMPGLNGRALADHLRRERPALKVLFTSGYSEEVAAHGLSADASTFVEKPYTPESLAREVGKVLGRETA
jgi:PAS domain S-box-containing protein